MKITRDRYGNKLHCGPTFVFDSLCVWRKCFVPHDWGYRASNSEWIADGRCNTSARSGCPVGGVEFVTCCDKPEFAVIKKGQQKKRCKSCGLLVPVEVVRWLIEQKHYNK